MSKGMRRSIHLLATSSVIALSIAIAPVAVDLNSPHPFLKTALAEDSCCFTGETRVLMADGRERPIRSIRIGDLVLGPSGRVNRVVRIERPALGTRYLYALNGGPHFVTAEHPFATLGGWRAIDPAATRAEGSRLSVGRLQLGDCLQVRASCMAHSTVGALALSQPALLSVVLHSLDASAAAADTPLFNLLLDGDHAYFADGYLVHNKGEGGESGGEGEGEGEGSGGSGEGEGEGEGEGGESGESGSSGPSSSSGSGDSSGSLLERVEQNGPDLSPSEEAEAIAKGWQ